MEKEYDTLQEQIANGETTNFGVESIAYCQRHVTKFVTDIHTNLQLCSKKSRTYQFDEVVEDCERQNETCNVCVRDSVPKRFSETFPRFNK